MPILFIIALTFGAAKTAENHQLCTVNGPQTAKEVAYCENLAEIGDIGTGVDLGGIGIGGFNTGGFNFGP
jgi:hypothetical protein